MLANRLKAILAERNMTIQNIVDNTTLSRNTISNLINKPQGNINISTVDEICSFLGIPISDFFVFYPYSLVGAGISKDSLSTLNHSMNFQTYLTFKHLGEEFNITFQHSIKKEQHNNKPVLLITLNTNDKIMEKLYEEMPPYFQQVIINQLIEIASNCILSSYFKDHPEDRFYQTIDMKKRPNEFDRDIPSSIAMECKIVFASISVVRSLIVDLSNINKEIKKNKK